MYNVINRDEMFRWLRTRAEFQRCVPAYRVFYGRQGRIFLNRSDGELAVPVLPRRQVMGTVASPRDETADACPSATDTSNGEEDGLDILCDDYGATTVRKIMQCIRSCKGVQQGCVLATNGACLPYHLALHRVQRSNSSNRDVRWVCDADDTYGGGPGRAL